MLQVQHGFERQKIQMLILDSDSFFLRRGLGFKLKEIRETCQLEVNFLHSWAVVLPKF